MPENIGREVTSGVSPAGSRELNITHMSQIRAEQDAARKRYVEDEIKDAAEIYANKMGVNFDDAHKLMAAKYQNQVLSKKFEIEQETKNLQANNEYIKAQSELGNISYTDKDALRKLSEARSRWSSALAGTQYEPLFAKSISSLESGVSGYQTSQHYQNLDDPEKQAFLTKTKAIAEAQVKAPYADAEQKAKDQAAIQRAILQYAVKNDMSVKEATEALYPTQQKPAMGAGATTKVAPTMPQDIVTKIPMGSSLQIKGGLGTPVMGVESPGVPKQEPTDIMSPIDESTEQPPSVAPSATEPVSKPLTKEALHSLAEELGANATKESLMDLAKKRGYTF